jgi:ADP-heptose:LPS heptosyltransferase
MLRVAKSKFLSLYHLRRIMHVKHSDPAGIKRILVVKLSSLGDIVHATPCLRAIREFFPAADISMVVDRRFADIIRHNPRKDALIESERRPGLLATWAGIRAELAPFLTGRARFDLAVDFQGTARSAAWVYASGARIKAGRGAMRPGWQGAVSPDLSRHAVCVCAEIARSLEIPVSDLNPEVFLSPTDEEVLNGILRAQGVPREGFLLLNPFSRWESKEWPMERYVDILQQLGGEISLPVVLAGSAAEATKAGELLRRLDTRQAWSLAGKLTLGQAACLYGRARLMLTGDSGPMHIAAALGVPLVALFGPTLPEQTGPWGQAHMVVQAIRPAHHHVYRSDPEQTHMRAIDPATVLAAIRRQLRASEPNRRGGI